MTQKYISLLCMVFLLTACNKEIPPVSSKDDFILSAAQMVEESDAAGVAVAIVRADGRIWAHGFGYADLANKKPMTKDTVISIGSITKTITGVAVMQAVEQGLIDLDGDINDYLPFKVVNPKQQGHIITPRHILTHTTGIVDYDPVYESAAVYHFGGDNPIALKDFLKSYLVPGGEYYSASNNFTDTAPGDRYSYSNIVYGLAGLMVETVTGQAFSQYTRDKILKPLGMLNSGWKYHDINDQTLGQQYGLANDIDDERIMTGEVLKDLKAFKRYGLTTYPDGGLRTSVVQLSRFLAAIMNNGSLQGNRILKEETLATMLTPESFGHTRIADLPKPIIGQALTFRHLSYKNNGAPGVLTGHTGGDPGTNTFMYFDPDRKIGVITFTNSDTGAEPGRTLIRMMFENAAIFFSK